MIDPARLPARVLLCLNEGCYGEFYYPLTLDERIGCPYDGTHPVAVYSGPTLHRDPMGLTDEAQEAR